MFKYSGAAVKDQRRELSELIRRIKSFELPQVDIHELCTPCPSIDLMQFKEILKNALCGKKNHLFLDVRLGTALLACYSLVL